MEQADYAIEIVNHFMSKNPNTWVWESLIESVFEHRGFLLTDCCSEAVYASAIALRRQFPGDAWINKAADVLAVIDREFHEIAAGKTAFDEQKAADRRQHLASTFSRYAALLIELPRFAFQKTNGRYCLCSTEPDRLYDVRDSLTIQPLGSSMGIYALYRDHRNPFPSYIGEGEIKSRLCRHLNWWGREPMFVTIIRESDDQELKSRLYRLAVEGFLVAAFPGVSNID